MDLIYSWIIALNIQRKYFLIKVRRDEKRSQGKRTREKVKTRELKDKGTDKVDVNVDDDDECLNKHHKNIYAADQICC